MNVAVAPRTERSPIGELDAALALAARGDGLTFVALRAPVVAPAAIVDAWPDVPLVAWSTANLALAGIGTALELRGHGPDRWTQVIAAARAVRVHGAIVVDGSPSTSSSSALGLATPSGLGFARPRFIGGAAFTPGAASAPPWAGFGDAWFVLPRWMYVHDQTTAWLVLAVDAHAARDVMCRHAELVRFRAAFAGTWTRPSERDPRSSPPNGAAGDRPGAIHDPAPSLPTGVGGDRPRAITASDSGGIALEPAAADLYRAQVAAITSAIAGGDCSKIVAARSCSMSLEHATAASVLATLDARHPECFRVVVRPPGGGALVAATPERLVRIDADGIRCDALAGTVRLDSPDAEARLLASDKDRREHALVVDAIAGALGDLGVTVEAAREPAIKRLRHVLHLHTPIRASAPRDTSLHLLELAARLHPTPAVGGTPTPFAIDWIRDHEPVPRGWYASPVGWFDLDGHGELAVAIRSGVLAGDRAHLWAGAGIVAGSDPDRELAETELKLRAMLGALRGDGGAA